MPTAPLIHPTAIVSADAHLAADVTVGPFTIIDGPVVIGSGSAIGPHCHLLGHLTLGAGNVIGTGCVLGDKPQHLAYKNEPTRTVIGDNNVFREYVTVHRGMPVGSESTTIGNNNLFMVNSHVAHDCHVGSHCIFANGAVIGGHVEVGDRAFLSGNSAVHQLCRVGRLALIGGTSAISQDLPPFWICQGRINTLHGVNVIGMRRAGMAKEEIAAVRQAYKLLNRTGNTIPSALEIIEAEFGTLPAIRELIAFIKTTKRGICTGHQKSNDDTHDPD